ncbi:hypothetical protein HPB50_029202 [Hyalomma asiaticum]|nr:hypothetical protein HPB50_029202 [Hyalomma asiaticum]
MAAWCHQGVVKGSPSAEYQRPPPCGLLGRTLRCKHRPTSIRPVCLDATRAAAQVSPCHPAQVPPRRHVARRSEISSTSNDACLQDSFRVRNCRLLFGGALSYRQLHQALEPPDFHNRTDFVNWVLIETERDPGFVNKVLWTDGANFSRSAQVNIYNAHYGVTLKDH